MIHFLVQSNSLRLRLIAEDTLEFVSIDPLDQWLSLRVYFLSVDSPSSDYKLLVQIGLALSSQFNSRAIGRQRLSRPLNANEGPVGSSAAYELLTPYYKGVNEVANLNN